MGEEKKKKKKKKNGRKKKKKKKKKKNNNQHQRHRKKNKKYKNRNKSETHQNRTTVKDKLRRIISLNQDKTVKCIHQRRGVVGVGGGGGGEVRDHCHTGSQVTRRDNEGRGKSRGEQKAHPHLSLLPVTLPSLMSAASPR